MMSGSRARDGERDWMKKRGFLGFVLAGARRTGHIHVSQAHGMGFGCFVLFSQRRRSIPGVLVSSGMGEGVGVICNLHASS